MKNVVKENKMIEVQEQCMKLYRSIIDSNPVLSRKEESEIIRNIYKQKDEKAKNAAREVLFNSNIRLVLKEVSKYSKYIPITDLMNAGCEGLWIATGRFDPKFKTKFSTYATPWVRLKIYQLVNTLGTMVHIPSNIKNKSHKYKSIMSDDRELDDKEIMEELQVSKKGLAKIRYAQGKQSTLSLDHEYSIGDGGATLSDFIADDTSNNPSVECQLKDRKDMIKVLLNGLPPIQRDVLMYRYLMDGKMNLSEIGEKWNISGERVRQIELKALRKLRFRIKNKIDLGVE